MALLGLFAIVDETLELKLSGFVAQCRTWALDLRRRSFSLEDLFAVFRLRFSLGGPLLTRSRRSVEDHDGGPITTDKRPWLGRTMLKQRHLVVF